MNCYLGTRRSLVLLLMLVLGALPGRGQKWIAPTPEELSMTEQKGAPGADAVFLFHEEITDDDAQTITFHNRIKILKPDGEELARVVLNSYLPESGYDRTIREFSGRTIHSDGTVIPMTQSPAMKVASGAGGKTVQRTYELPQPDVGSILEYRLTIQLDFHVLSPTWLVQRKYFVRKAHYEWFPGSGRLESRVTQSPPFCGCLTLRNWSSCAVADLATGTTSGPRYDNQLGAGTAMDLVFRG